MAEYGAQILHPMKYRAFLVFGLGLEQGWSQTGFLQIRSSGLRTHCLGGMGQVLGSGQIGSYHFPREQHPLDSENDSSMSSENSSELSWLLRFCAIFVFD